MMRDGCLKASSACVTLQSGWEIFRLQRKLVDCQVSVCRGRRLGWLRKGRDRIAVRHAPESNEVLKKGVASGE